MKIKAIWISCLVILLLLISLGCNKSNNRNDEQNIDLEGFLKSVTLPERFSVEIDTHSIRTRDKASVYTANYLQLDPDTATEALLSGEIQSTQSIAQGLWFEAGSIQKEYLILFDGGKSFGVNSGVDGGISYTISPVEGRSLRDKLTLVASPDGPTEAADVFEMKYGYTQLSRFDANTDLSFGSYRDALTSVTETLSTAGFPDMGISNSYSIDLETIGINFNLYMTALKDFNLDPDSDVTDTNWSIEDECYILMFHQVIDDIPVVNVPWQMKGGTSAAGNRMPYTFATVYYSMDGIISIYAVNMYESLVNEVEVDLINHVYAMRSLVDTYSELILDRDIRVVNMELNYVSIPSDIEFRLVPAWVFTLAEDRNVSNVDNNSSGLMIREYNYYVFDATTGERIF